MVALSGRLGGRPHARGTCPNEAIWLLHMADFYLRILLVSQASLDQSKTSTKLCNPAYDMW